MNSKKRLSSRSSLLLMELILAIAFFCGICAICLQIFAKAHTLQENSKQMNFAVTQCVSASSILSATGDLTALSDYYPDGVCTSDTFTSYFSKDQMTAGDTDAFYELMIQEVSHEKNLVSYKIQMNTENDEIYAIECVALTSEWEVD